MRLLALLGVAAGAVAVGLLVVVPSTPDAELSQGVRLIVNAVAVAMLGVSLTAFACGAISGTASPPSSRPPRPSPRATTR
jgi:hypothetical protein